jgi:hypothetical protein
MRRGLDDEPGATYQIHGVFTSIDTHCLRGIGTFLFLFF